ncbi:erythromycin esterase family protein [Phenylobacterium sp.]|uniref:erythromycin esterase family protein n=1 Tax=Phenylobacterium sp. TaxID=1871053 RepID=UPI002F425934
MSDLSEHAASHGVYAPRRGVTPPDGSTPRLIADAAEPLLRIQDPAFTKLFDRFGDARVVLLGEATHGTSEFYDARAAVTRRLVEQHGFNLVALEADWPDVRAVDRYVRRRGKAPDAQPVFQRFPTWMWRNAEFEGFVEWMRDHNRFRTVDERVSIHGLDLFSLGASMTAVIDYLDRVDPAAAAVARERYGCLTPWVEDPQAYGARAYTSGYAQCETPVNAMLRDLLEKRLEYDYIDEEGFLDATANARLLADAEAYFRAIYFGQAEAWNLRDRHMMDILNALLEARGPDSKAVVWAHNSHIGDARATAMGRDQGEINLGQLARERFGEAAILIGFGTNLGAVACASDWGGPMEVKRLNPAAPESYERLAWDSDVPAFLLDLRPGVVDDELRQRLSELRPERFIGVIYRPETERISHYASCVLPEQFDAYVWFDQTHAVRPLPAESRQGAPDTYPFGL